MTRRKMKRELKAIYDEIESYIIKMFQWSEQTQEERLKLPTLCTRANVLENQLRETALCRRVLRMIGVMK